MNEDQQLSVALPTVYWAIILGLLENKIQESKSTVDAMRSRGTTAESLTPEDRTILAGPFLARGIIIDAMVEAGHMSQASKHRCGAKAILARAQAEGN